MNMYLKGQTTASFLKKLILVIFLSSGVARQQNKAREDLIALLLHGFSKLRYIINTINPLNKYRNDNFIFWTSFLSPIPRRKMTFSTIVASMLSLVGQIKSSLNCDRSLELRDITHAQLDGMFPSVFR